MNKYIILILAGLIFIVIMSAWQPASPERSILPATIEGWTAQEKPEVYKGDNLYLYINGGAEIYHEYGFSRVTLTEYKSEDGSSIAAEIYKMKTPESAFGIYSFKTTSQGRSVPYGEEGRLEDYYMNFWKGRFLVTLTGYDEKESTIAGLETIADAINHNLQNGGKTPALTKFIPNEGLHQGSIKYFRGRLGLLNSHRFFDEHILDFEEGVRGDYSDNHSVFIFAFNTASHCTERFERIRSIFHVHTDFTAVPGPDPEMAASKDREGINLSVYPDGRYLIIIRGSKKQEIAIREIHQIRQKLNH